MSLISRAQAPEKLDSEAAVVDVAAKPLKGSGTGKSRRKAPAVRAEDPVTIVVRRMSLRDVAAVFHIGEVSVGKVYTSWLSRLGILPVRSTGDRG
jgi:hypothetical protein